VLPPFFIHKHNPDYPDQSDHKNTKQTDCAYRPLKRDNGTTESDYYISSLCSKGDSKRIRITRTNRNLSETKSHFVLFLISAYSY